jgi:hypothetical protein
VVSATVVGGVASFLAVVSFLEVALLKERPSEPKIDPRFSFLAGVSSFLSPVAGSTLLSVIGAATTGSGLGAAGAEVSSIWGATSSTLLGSDGAGALSVAAGDFARSLEPPKNFPNWK